MAYSQGSRQVSDKDKMNTKEKQMIDYSISWGYIVARMKSLHGISPDDDEPVAYGDIERRMNLIWKEYFEILSEEEKKANE